MPFKSPKRRFVGTAGVCALVCLAVFATEAHTGRLMPWEETFFRAIYGLGDGWRPVFLAITQTGSAWMVALIPLATWSMKQKLLAWRLLVVSVAAIGSGQLLKMIVDRPRPAALLEGYSQREPYITGSGFPSIHTSLATALAVSILLLWPGKRKKRFYLLLLWPLAVGLSRLYLGVHAPLDVAGGLMVGIVVSCVAAAWWGMGRRAKNH